MKTPVHRPAIYRPSDLTTLPPSEEGGGPLWGWGGVGEGGGCFPGAGGAGGPGGSGAAVGGAAPSAAGTGGAPCGTACGVALARALANSGSMVVLRYMLLLKEGGGNICRWKGGRAGKTSAGGKEGAFGSPCSSFCRQGRGRLGQQNRYRGRMMGSTRWCDKGWPAHHSADTLDDAV